MPKNRYCVAGVLAAAMFFMNSDKAGLSVNAAVVKNAALDSDEASEEKNTKTTRITLDYDQVFIEGSGASYDEESRISLTAGGTYIISGQSESIYFYIDCNDAETVSMVFDNAEIISPSTSVIFCEKAENLILETAPHSSNYVSDIGGRSGTAEILNPADALIYSKSDLTLKGNGSIEIFASYHEGICTEGDFSVESGSINLSSNNNGISVQGEICIEDGSLFVSSQRNGLNAQSEEKNVYILGGTIDIFSLGDGIRTESDMYISGGSLSVVAGNGSESEEDILFGDSHKGIFIGSDLYILNGTVHVDSFDYSLYIEDNMKFTGGYLNLQAGTAEKVFTDSLKI